MTTPFQQFTADMADADERRRAAMSKEERTIAAAFEMTEKERAQLEAANAAVEEAEAEVNALGLQVAKAREDKAGSDRTEMGVTREGRSFFRRIVDAEARKRAASLPGLLMDLQDARSRLENAIRRLNATRREIDAARFERRRAAKLKVSPKLPPARSRGDKWIAAFGGKEAA